MAQWAGRRKNWKNLARRYKEKLCPYGEVKEGRGSQVILPPAPCHEAGSSRWEKRVGWSYCW